MTTPLTPDELAAIRQRADAATPGPWVSDGRVGCAAIYATNEIGEKVDCFDELERVIAYHRHSFDDQQHEADWSFIAHARTDVPRLLDEVERLESELATEKRHWIEDDRDLNELLEANARLERENAELRAKVETDNRRLAAMHSVNPEDHE